MEDKSKEFQKFIEDMKKEMSTNKEYQDFMKDINKQKTSDKKSNQEVSKLKDQFLNYLKVKHQKNLIDDSFTINFLLENYLYGDDIFNLEIEYSIKHESEEEIEWVSWEVTESEEEELKSSLIKLIKDSGVETNFDLSHESDNEDTYLNFPIFNIHVEYNSEGNNKMFIENSVLREVEFDGEYIDIEKEDRKEIH